MDYGDPNVMAAYQDAYQAQMNLLAGAAGGPQVVAPPPGVQANRFNPYGGGGGGGKGKGKGKTKGKDTMKGKPVNKEKPVVNVNQINASKEPMSGGISFKNIFQEKLSKQIHRPLLPGDVVYTCTRGQGGKLCTMTIPCLGEEHKFESDLPAADDKQAGQIASSKALEVLFPDVYIAVLEAYNTAKEELQGSAGATGDGTTASAATTGEPKSELNNRVLAVIGRPCTKEDVVYETKWDRAINGYVCTVKLNALDGGQGHEVYSSDLIGCNDQKMAEKDAAKKALEANKARFDLALMDQEAKKAQKVPWGSKGKGKGKGFPGFGKGKGKGGGGVVVPPSMGFHGAG